MSFCVESKIIVFKVGLERFTNVQLVVRINKKMRELFGDDIHFQLQFAN